jgi:hypothetical protein
LGEKNYKGGRGGMKMKKAEITKENGMFKGK